MTDDAYSTGNLALALRGPYRLMARRYVSGRTRDWLKFKNPEAPAVQREAKEDWGRQ